MLVEVGQDMIQTSIALGQILTYSSFASVLSCRAGWWLVMSCDVSLSANRSISSFGLVGLRSSFVRELTVSSGDLLLIVSDCHWQEEGSRHAWWMGLKSCYNWCQKLWIRASIWAWILRDEFLSSLGGYGSSSPFHLITKWRSRWTKLHMKILVAILHAHDLPMRVGGPSHYVLALIASMNVFDLIRYVERKRTASLTL